MYNNPDKISLVHIHWQTMESFGHIQRPDWFDSNATPPTTLQVLNHVRYALFDPSLPETNKLYDTFYDFGNVDEAALRALEFVRLVDASDPGDRYFCLLAFLLTLRGQLKHHPLLKSEVQHVASAGALEFFKLHNDRRNRKLLIETSFNTPPSRWPRA